jgi:hypothetical protein
VYRPADARVDIVAFTPPSERQVLAGWAGVTFAAGDQFGAQALEDGTVRLYRNGSRIGSASIAGWSFATLGGRIGLYVAGAQDARFDDFGGGTIEPESSPPLAVPTTRPGTAWVSAAFPNPTRGGATFSLVLPTAQEVSLSVLDIQGREVWRVPSRRYDAGSWSLAWEGTNVPVGLYLARVRVGTEDHLRRVAVLH